MKRSRSLSYLSVLSKDDTPLDLKTTKLIVSKYFEIYARKLRENRIVRTGIIDLKISKIKASLVKGYLFVNHPKIVAHFSDRMQRFVSKYIDSDASYKISKELKDEK